MIATMIAAVECNMHRKEGRKEAEKGKRALGSQNAVVRWTDLLREAGRPENEAHLFENSYALIEGHAQPLVLRERHV